MKISINRPTSGVILYLCILFLMLWQVAFASTPPDSSAYTVNPIPCDFVDISTTGTRLSLGPRDGIAGIPLGFDFYFYGIKYTTVTVAADGYLSFAPFMSTDKNTPLPSATLPDNIIAPFWDALDPRHNSQSGIYFVTTGTAPFRQFIVQWDDVPLAADPQSRLTFEVVLYESSDEIQFRYAAMDAGLGRTRAESGSSASIGVENSDGTKGTEIAFHQDRIVTHGVAFSLTRGGNAFIQGRLLGDLDNDRQVTIVDQSLITDIITGEKNSCAARELLLADIAPAAGTGNRSFGDGMIDGLDHARLFHAVMGREALNPLLSGASYVSALPNEIITLYGSGFAPDPASNSVVFTNVNGASQTLTAFTVSTDGSTLTVPVPIGLKYITSVKTVREGLASNALLFIEENAPVITRLYSPAGGAGDTVRISGYEFGRTPQDNIVRFNGVQATVQTARAEGIIDELLVIVPAGANTGPVTVTTNTQTSNGVNFTVGFIKSPRDRESVTGLVPVILEDGLTIFDATVEYWPLENVNAYRSIVSGVDISGGEVLAELDTTLLANGAYAIRVTGVDEAGTTKSGIVMVLVTGENKPGRVRFTITDLTIPVSGFPITVGRTYDSLERHESGDFGYGWSLAIANPKLEIAEDLSVTLTMPNGKRVTFFFEPSFTLGFGIPRYIPEAGVYGSLEPHGCELVVNSGGQYFCFPGGLYKDSLGGFTYTDPYGRKFELGKNGTLRSITDLQGNTLTFTSAGITSSAGGLGVTFERDGAGRITAITDPAGNIFAYTYNTAGDLTDVTVPEITTPITYTYDDDHFFLSAVDHRGNPIIRNTYYPDGRLRSETDALGYTSYFEYDLINRLTTITNPDGGKQIEQRDAYGNIVSNTDPLGRTTTCTYDSLHNRITEKDPLGNITRYTYDTQGNVTSKTDPRGYVTRTAYNSFGGITSVTDAEGNTTTVTYDQYLIGSIQDSLGTLARFTWDARGNMLSMTNADGHATTYEYDQYGNKTKEIDALGNETVYGYDLLGRLTSVTNALGDTVSYTLDAYGRKIQENGPLGQVLKYQYDGNGNLLTYTLANGAVINRTYDARNRIDVVIYPDGSRDDNDFTWRDQTSLFTNPAGRAVGYAYDRAGQMSGITYAPGKPEAGVALFEYNAAGNKITEIDGLGNSTHYAYDASGNIIRIVDASERTISRIINGNGKVTSRIDVGDKETKYTYDARSRLVRTDYSDGTYEIFSYNGAGLLTGKTDRNGKTTTYTYDAAYRIAAVINPLGEKTSYQYDAVGNLVKITDANNHVTTFVFDKLGRQIRKELPDSTFETWAYDTENNLVTHTLADGNTNTYFTNERGHLVRINTFDGKNITFAYYPDGHRKSYTDESGTTRYEYDYRGFLTRVENPDGQYISYTYDALGNRIAMQTSAESFSYTYNKVQQLLAVTDGNNNTYTYTYNEAGQKTSLTYPNGVISEYSYNSQNLLTGLTHSKDNAILASYTYTLDAVGNKLSVTEADGHSLSWEYDDAYRLTAELYKHSSGTVLSRTDYTYDAVGNRLTKSDGSSTIHYTYNETDQLVSDGIIDYTYDARGNLSRRSDGTVYSWDALDRLAGVQLPDGQAITYNYDADGRKVTENRCGEVTRYLWDTASPFGDVVLETDAAGNPLVSYTLGGSELLAQNRNGTLSAYLTDGCRNIRLLTDNSGTVTDTYNYDAFGTLTSRTGTTPNSYFYTGQRYDEASELYDLRARSYHPLSGRFLSRDPMTIDTLNPVEWNRYAYAANNPINAYDPTGYMALAEYGLTTSESGTKDSAAAKKEGDTLRFTFFTVFTMVEQPLYSKYRIFYSGKFKFLTVPVLAAWRLGRLLSTVTGFLSMYLSWMPHFIMLNPDTASGLWIATVIETDKTLTRVEKDLYWRVASAAYALNAEHIALIFYHAVSNENIFWEVERPILKAKARSRGLLMLYF